MEFSKETSQKDYSVDFDTINNWVSSDSLEIINYFIKWLFHADFFLVEVFQKYSLIKNHVNFFSQIFQ